jgi:hypothetical protein
MHVCGADGDFFTAENAEGTEVFGAQEKGVAGVLGIGGVHEDWD